MLLIFLIWIISTLRVSGLGAPRLPQMDENGKLLPTQCHGSTGYCWCVGAGGEKNNMTPPGVELNCE